MYKKQELVPFETFYETEGHHQDYFEKVSTVDGNTNDAYYQFSVVPEIEKIQEKFTDRVRAEAEPDT